MRRTIVGVITAVAGQAISIAAVLKEFVITPVSVCSSSSANTWLVAAAIGPLLVFVGVALYIDGRSKRPDEWDA